MDVHIYIHIKTLAKVDIMPVLQEEELVECLLANVSLEDKDSEDNSPHEEPISPLNLEEQQEEEGEEDNENEYVLMGALLMLDFIII